MQEEIKLEELQEEYREQDRRGIPMSVREQYWNKLDELKEEVRAKAHRKALGQVLLEKELLTDEEIQDALTEQDNSREDRLIGEVLLEKGLIDKEELRDAVKEQVKKEKTKKAT